MKRFIWILIFFTSTINSQEVRKTIFGGLAIEGYDAIAYFTVSSHVKGKSEFEFTWRNAKWRFSNKENLEAFKASPEKYAPQYGGHCAFGMSNGEKYGISPDAWTIFNGKLYFNYDKNVQKEWVANKSDLITKADKFWKNFLSDK